MIVGRQGTHNTEIHGDVLRVLRVFGGDENIARVHVGMKKIVAKHLGKKDFYTLA